MAEDRPVDVTGTMVKGIEGWQKRVEELAKPEYWYVSLTPRVEMTEQLSDDEFRRLAKKVKMVKEAVKWMLAGMVKGTVKYSSDDWTLERWMAHLVGEGADQMNYQILLFNKFHEENKNQVDAIERARATWKEEFDRQFTRVGGK